MKAKRFQKVENRSDLSFFFSYQKVYRKETASKKTWQEARDFCKTIGGDLMSIHSMRDMSNIEYVCFSKHAYVNDHNVSLGNHLRNVKFCWLKGFVIQSMPGLASGYKEPMRALHGVMVHL